ncbi:MAG TPA: TonB family protein [Longimicrobiales bacterium]
MMATWLFYCALVATLLGIAAVAGEAALRAAGRPVRWVWVGAMAGSLAMPLAAWLGWPSWGGEAPVTADPAVLEQIVVQPSLPAAPAAGLLDTSLRYAWLAASALFLLVVLASLLRLWRERAGWRRAEVGGTPVLVSGRTGPAALGFVRGSIVIPEWALALDARLRELMLLHESEHLRAGDPRLVVAAVAALIAMPWNPALWWQFWRLRQALELDCDARVLRRVPDARAYGELLLEVGRRRGAGALMMAGLVEPKPFLERRIRLIGRRGGPRRGRFLASAGASALLVIGACEAPEPLAIPEEQPQAAVGGDHVVLDPVPDGADPAECRPVMYVDGVRIGTFPGKGESAVENLGPDDIERIEVRKGAAISFDPASHTTKLGGCGEIRITTKAAAQGRAAAAAAERDAVRAATARLAEAVQPSEVRSTGARARGPLPGTLTFPESGGTFRVDEGRAFSGTLTPSDAGGTFRSDFRFPPSLRRAGGASEPEASTPSAERERRLTTAAAALRRAAGEKQQPSIGRVRPSLANVAEVQQALAASYPAALRDAGIGGSVTMFLFIDAQGTVVNATVSASSGYPALDAAAQRVANVMRFLPALNVDGEPVPVWIQIPVSFQTAGAPAS